MDCLFCKVIAGEIPCDKVYESENLLAFRDISPVADQHVLVIPKKHVASAIDLDDSDSKWLGELHISIGKIADKLGLRENGFRLISNIGRHGGQSVAHLHYHIIGGKPLGWPPFPEKQS